jgi:hypothetical protein
LFEKVTVGTLPGRIAEEIQQSYLEEDRSARVIDFLSATWPLNVKQA